jgi:hypothetical protein
MTVFQKKSTEKMKGLQPIGLLMKKRRLIEHMLSLQVKENISKTKNP